MKNFFIAFGLVVVLLALYFLFSNHATRSQLTQRSPEVLQKQSPDSPTELKLKLNPASPSLTMDRSIKRSASGDTTPLELIQKTMPMAKLIPKIDDVRKEIEENPHDTPDSLLRFSIELSDKLEIALKSKEASEYFLKELGECADTNRAETSTAASASCVKNAYAISAVYKELEPMADEIKGRANADTQKLYKNMQQLGL